MTSKERILTAFAHKEPDRVPIYELAITPQVQCGLLGLPPTNHENEMRLDIKAWQEGKRDELVYDRIKRELEAHRLLRFDMMVIRPCMPAGGGFFPKEVEPHVWLYDDGQGHWTRSVFEPGADVLFPQDCHLMHTRLDGLRENVENMERGLEGKSDQELVDDTSYDALKYVLANEKNMFILGHADVTCPTIGPWITLYLEALIEAPDLVQRYMQATMRGELAHLRRQLELGVDGVVGANDWYSKKGPLMSPRMFREFVMPYLKQVVDEVHKAGKPFIKHLDGNTRVNWQELWVELGIDGYHAIEPTAGMDIGELKQLFGSHLTVLGNIDCGHTLTEGAEEEIISEVKRILRVASPGGGHVFSSSNALHGKVPVKNVWTMVNAVREFGRYPINIP
jgi:uroporphyrinogen decarboxylase